MTAGRPPGIPRDPNSGRKPGTKNRELPDKKILAEHILETYMKLGGPAFLLSWAKANNSDFVKYALSRFWPAMPRAEDPAIVNNVMVQLDSLSEIERARRVAFLMASAADKLGLPPVIQHQPVTTPDWRLPGPVTEPVDVAEIARKQEAEALVQNSLDGSYPGSSREQNRKNLI